MTGGVPRRRLGLRTQILLGLALVTLLAVTSTAYLALWAAGDSLRAERESSLLSLSTAAAAACAAALDLDAPTGEPDNRARLARVLGPMIEREGSLQVSVLGLDRRVLAARPPRLPEDQDPALLTAVLAGVPALFHYRQRPGEVSTELCGYAPILAAGRVLAAARACVSAPPPVTAVLRRSQWLFGIAVADALMVLALGSFVLTSLVVRPLQAMERATARVSAGEWDQRIAASGPREIAALAASFNQMTASLVAQREQLIRSEKLASVGQLAAGVAHEIGNPLAAVLGYVDILRADAAADDGAGKLSEADRRDALSRVKAETQRIDRIIHDLLEYSRPSREEAQPADPLQVLRSAEALLRPQARFRAVAVTTEPAASSWPEVLVSPGRLTQVFVNLLLNAADAMKGEGTVRVVCQRRDARVEIGFCDVGPGIAADVRGKIFDPFFTTKDPGKGTGLGLSVSRSIVEACGGTLELAPATADPGARFVVTLPAAPV